MWLNLSLRAIKQGCSKSCKEQLFHKAWTEISRENELSEKQAIKCANRVTNLSFLLVEALASCQFPAVMHLDEEIYTIAMQILVQVTYMA